MKSKPSAGGSAMGSHFCSLSRAPDSQSPIEVNMSGSCSTLASGPLNEKIRRDYLSFLSSRCLIYEWIMSERRISHWRSEAPSAWPFSVKGTVRLLWEDRISVRVSGGMGAKSESNTHVVSVRRTVVTLTPKLIRPGDAVWRTDAKQGWIVEKVGHTSCLRRWVSIYPACAVHNKEDGTPSAVATATSGW